MNEAFHLWLERGYHEVKHRSTGQTPLHRFTSNMECLRPAPADLADHFRIVARRRVEKDRTITLNGKLFEAPVALIGKQVELLYHEGGDSPVEVRFGGKSFGFIGAVDVHVNCRVKRDKNHNAQVIPSGPQGRYKGGKLWSGGAEPEDRP